MPNSTTGRQPEIRLPATDVSTHAVVTLRTLKASAPDLTEQIKPIAEMIFAVASERTGRLVARYDLHQQPPQQFAPTARSDKEVQTAAPAAIAAPSPEPAASLRQRPLHYVAAFLLILLIVAGAFAPWPMLVGAIWKSERAPQTHLPN